MWDEIAQQLLTAATGTSVTVARQFVAPGPIFARDCRLIAVVLLRPAVVPLQREWAGSCAVVPQLTYQVVFAADCVPPVNDDGSPPSSTAVDAWSTAFLADCDLIFNAVLEAATSGQIAGGCHAVSVGQTEMRGPQGGMASMVVPVTVNLAEADE